MSGRMLHKEVGGIEFKNEQREPQKGGMTRTISHSPIDRASSVLKEPSRIHHDNSGQYSLHKTGVVGSI
jgi:hypothetical protein